MRPIGSAKCSECKFVSNDGNNQFTCRKYAPKAFVLGLNEHMQPMIVTVFPQIQAAAWCGEFEVKLDILSS